MLAGAAIITALMLLLAAAPRAEAAACVSMPMAMPPVVCTTPVVTVVPTATTVPVGGSIMAIASVSGGATGTVTFAFYAPSDPNCASTTPTTLAPVAIGALSPPFTPTTAGVYHFIATYNGDATHTVAKSPCSIQNQPLTSFTATALHPTLTTVASPTVPVGGMISAKATLTGAFNPTGTVTFKIYGTNDPGCVMPPIGTSTAIPVAAPTMSPVFTAAGAGTYRFVATYSGDGGNTGVSSSCADPAAAVTVTGPAAPVAPGTPGTPASCDPVAMATAVVNALVASLTGTPGASFKTTCSAGVRIVMRAKEIRPGNAGIPRHDGFTTIANVLTHSSAAGALPFALNAQGLALRKYASAHGRSLVVFAIVHIRPDPSLLSSEAIQIFSLT